MRDAGPPSKPGGARSRLTRYASLAVPVIAVGSLFLPETSWWGDTETRRLLGATMLVYFLAHEGRSIARGLGAALRHLRGRQPS